MSYLLQLLDFILHIDNYLFLLIQDYGVWIYAILFLIIFLSNPRVLRHFFIKMDIINTECGCIYGIKPQ